MMELQSKIIDALNCTFIGEVIFSDDELNQMKTDAKRSWVRSKSSYSKDFKNEEMESLIVLIVNLAKSWGDGNENRFWVKILNEIFEDSSVSQIKFYNEFEHNLNKYNKIVFVSPSGKRMFKEVMLFHAFAPQVSIDALASLLWGYYVDDEVLALDYQLGNPMHSQIAKFLSKKFSGDLEDGDLVLEGKTYALRAAIKYGFSQDLVSSERLIDRTIKCFDEVYINNKIHFSDYYSKCILSTIEKILLVEKRKKGERTRTIREQIITDLTKIDSQIFYQLVNEDINIVIPEMRGFEEEYEEVRIELYSGEKKLSYTYEDYVVGRDLVRKRVKRIEIPLSKIIKEFKDTIDLRIKIYFDGTLYSDTKEKLFRNFILFKQNRLREIKGDCQPGSYVLAFAPSAKIDKYTNCSLSSFGRSYLVSINAQENDHITFNDKYVFFNSDKKSSHIIFGSKQIENLIFQKNGNNYIVFKNLKTIGLILDDKMDLEKITVIHNYKEFKKLSAILEKQETAALINIDILGWNKEGPHQLVIKDISSNKTISVIEYAIFEGLALHSKKSYVFDNISAEIVLARYENEIIFSEFCPNSNSKTYCDYSDGQFEISIPTVKWKINDGEWQESANMQVLYKQNEVYNNNSVIKIENNSYEQVSICVDGKIIEETTPNAFLIGDALLKNVRSRSNRVDLKIGTDIFMLCTIYNEEVFVEESSPLFLFENNKLSIDFSEVFVGEKDRQFEVLLYDDENKYQPIRCGIQTEIEIDLVDNEYSVEVYLIKENFFADEDNKMLLYNSDIILGKPEKFYFNNKRIVLSKGRMEKGSIKFENCVMEQIEYIKEEQGLSVYQAVYKTSKSRAETIEFENRGKTLTMYFANGEDLIIANADIEAKRLTKEPINNKNIVACSSCYFEEEEI